MIMSEVFFEKRIEIQEAFYNADLCANPDLDPKHCPPVLSVRLRIQFCRSGRIRNTAACNDVYDCTSMLGVLESWETMSLFTSVATEYRYQPNTGFKYIRIVTDTQNNSVLKNIADDLHFDRIYVLPVHF